MKEAASAETIGNINGNVKKAIYLMKWYNGWK